jgi:hypothetical protein
MNQNNFPGKTQMPQPVQFDTGSGPRGNKSPARQAEEATRVSLKVRTVKLSELHIICLTINLRLQAKNLTMEDAIKVFFEVLFGTSE